jgi:U3 small nucleolar RNA-associated protein 18
MDKKDIEIPPKDEEELALEKLVFGDLESFEANLKNVNNLLEYSEDEYTEESEASDEESQDEEAEDMFFIDEGDNDGDAMDVDGSNDEFSGNDNEDESETENSSDNAWSDSEDERINISLMGSDRLKKLRKREQDDYISGKSYTKRLRSQFEKIYPKPSWAEEREQDDTQQEDVENTNSLLNILNQTDKFVATKQLKLISPSKISITRLKDGNQTRRSKGAIQSLCFHSRQPLLLTGGFDRTLRIYHIDGKVNSLVTSLFLKDSPVYTCQFLNLVTKDQQNLIYAAGRRRYMNKWDINSGQVEKISRMYGNERFQKSMEYFKISPKGNYVGLVGSSGYCNILNGLTGQFVKNYKVEGTIIDFEITNDEQLIIIINTMGEVWEFDLTSDKLIRRWQDDSGVGITKLKIGGAKNRWLAIGSNNGIVNLYDRHSITMTKPFKAVENLITTISTLEFNPDGQILVVASRGKRDALRLVHLPSGSVYSNWPTSGTPLGKVTAAAFSPDNQLLAIGNEAGKVTLWRLNHY